MHCCVLVLSGISFSFQSYKWSTDSILNTKKHPDNDGYWKLAHTIELTEGLWHAQVKTKNTHGWSHFSNDHSFVVADYSEDGEFFLYFLRDNILICMEFLEEIREAMEPVTTGIYRRCVGSFSFIHCFTFEWG